MHVIIFMCVGVGLLPDVYYIEHWSHGYNNGSLPRKFNAPGPCHPSYYYNIMKYIVLVQLYPPLYTMYVHWGLLAPEF